MIKTWSKIIVHEIKAENGYTWAKTLFTRPLDFKSLKLFSQNHALYQDRRLSNIQQERQLPTLLYIQNPVTWLINKIDFKMLKAAWDNDFVEEEFRRGTKQAVAVISTLISRNLWDNLRGLVTRQALVRLRREVEVEWSEELKNNIAFLPSDVKLALPRRIHFLRIADQKFADVDMLCVAMKFKEAPPSTKTDVVVIEIMARFHRNYSFGQLPNWTVTLFKVTKFSVKPGL